MLKGRVSSFWPQKHFGFFVSEDAPTEYFFHDSNIIDNGIPLERWSDVTFELAPHRDGNFKAVEIRALPREGGAR